VAKSAVCVRPGRWGGAEVSMEAGTIAVKHFLHNMPKSHHSYAQILQEVV